MATNPFFMFVAGMARVYLGEVGTPAPTTMDPATWDAGLKEVGLFTRDSLNFSTNPSFESITSAQSAYPTRRIENGAEGTLAVDLQEWKADNFKAVYGGGTVTETEPGSGIYKFSPPAVGARTEKMAVVLVQDGERNAVLVIPRVMQLQGVEHDLGGGSESILPLRLDVLGSGSGDPFYWLDDDEAAFAAAAPTATSIVPATGVAAGGYPALLTGTNLLAVTGVTFDGVAATNVEAVSDTKLYVTVPAGSAGAVDVVITDPSGDLTKADFFTYS